MIKFTCDGCIFSIKEEEKQIGCELGKLSIYEKREELLDEKINNHYVINRICTSARSKDWKWFDEDIKTQKEELDKENFVRFSFIVVHDDKSKSKELHETLKTITNMGNHPVIIISSKSENLKDIENTLCHSNYHFLEMREDITWSIHILKHLKNSYCVIVDSGHLFKSEFCEEFNKLVNEEMHPLLSILPDDKNPFIIHSEALKFFRDVKLSLEFVKERLKKKDPTTLDWSQV